MKVDLKSNTRLFSEAIGKALGNVHKVFYSLCFLPESYNMVVTNIDRKRTRFSICDTKSHRTRNQDYRKTGSKDS